MIRVMPVQSPLSFISIRQPCNKLHSIYSARVGLSHTASSGCRDVRLSVSVWNDDEGWRPNPRCVWLAGSVRDQRKELARNGNRLAGNLTWMDTVHTTSIRGNCHCERPAGAKQSTTLILRLLRRPGGLLAMTLAYCAGHCSTCKYFWHSSVVSERVTRVLARATKSSTRVR